MTSKMKFNGFAIILLLVFSACGPDGAILEKVDRLEKQVTELKQENSSVIVSLDEYKEKLLEGRLIHNVFFNFKKDISDKEKENFKSELFRLANIPHVLDIEVAEPADTGDKRLREDYDMVLFITFSEEEQLAKYQIHEIHLDVKKNVGPYLAQAPFVYDFKQRQ